LLLSSHHGQLQSKQVVEEQDQQRMFATEKGFLGQSLQRMLEIELAKKCIVDQHFFYYQILRQKETFKFQKNELFLEAFSCQTEKN
jgi:hypothetical protein